MNKDEKTIIVVIIVLLIGGGIFLGPPILKIMNETDKAVNYYLSITSPNIDEIDIYFFEDTREWFNLSMGYDLIGYELLHENTFPLDGFTRKVMKDAISFIYFLEQVNVDGFMEYYRSPVYRFTYYSLLDNGGGVVISLNQTYVQLKILEWE